MKKADTKPKRKHGGGRKAGPPSTGISAHINNEILKEAAKYTTINKVSRSKLIHDALESYLTSAAVPTDEAEFEQWLKREAPGFDYGISQAQFEMIFEALDEAINMLMLLGDKPGAKTRYADVYRKKEADVARLVSGFLKFNEEEALSYIRSILDQRKADRDERVRQDVRNASKPQAVSDPAPTVPVEPLLARIIGTFRRLPR